MADFRSPTSMLSLKNCGMSIGPGPFVLMLFSLLRVFTSIAFSPFLEFSILRKVGQPIFHKFKSFSLNSVNAHPALSLVRKQASSLKDLKVSRCRLPGVLKYCRDLPGCHLAAVEIYRQQYAPPGSVRECSKH